MTLWKDVIDIPEEVLRNDFVLKLTEGVERADETVRSYVVTPDIADAFDQALRLINAAVTNNKSVAAYLHGSFGSGKSHFMAMLNLILEGNKAAGEVENLGAVLSEYEWRNSRNFLMIPYHMMDAKSMEAAILGGYVDYVREHHPDAPVPGVYLDDRILENAELLRQKMGDTSFFEVLNKSSNDGWGSWSGAWTVESYNEALKAPTGSVERAKLVGDVVGHLLPATIDTAKSGDSGFVSLDEGLSIISHHAESLKTPSGEKYDGMILFLDELILWLASRSGDTQFLNREGAKISKLIEAQHADRPVPIISFVARQKDLREFLGSDHSGLQQFNVWQQLQYWDRGLDIITLGDQNLPLIVQKRLLNPVSAEAEGTIDQSFHSVIRSLRPDTQEAMTTSDGTAQDFRRVYPFSPALIKALIALSSMLHRERTSLRLMLALMVQRRDNLKLGDIIPVGDLWDVISEQQEPFSDVILQTFRSATKLYKERLLPMLWRTNNIHSEEEERTHKNFQNEDRIIKTLLMSQLVPGVEVFKDMTSDKLLALNHGLITAPVPGAESAELRRRLQAWAAEVGEIRLSEDTNPLVSLQLSNVDIDGILDRVKNQDNEGQRRRKVKALLYHWMDIDRESELFTTLKYPWRGAIRDIRVAYRNIREMPLTELETPDGAWQVVIDFPFDEEGKTPADDVAKVMKFREQYPEGTNTIAWLPAFLSARGKQLLGRLVRIDYVLNRFDEQTAHIAPNDRATVKNALESNKSALENQLKSALLNAYGLSRDNDESVDSNHRPQNHLESLRPNHQPGISVGSSFRDALLRIAENGLNTQYSESPKIPDERMTVGRAQKMADIIIEAIEAPEKRAFVENKDVRRDIKLYAEQLKLGQMGDTHFTWHSEWRRTIDTKLARGNEAIQLHEIHSIIDSDENPTGLAEPLRDLIIIAYAAMKNMVFKVGGQTLSPSVGKIDDRATLQTTALPSEDEWARGSKRTGDVLSIKPGQLVNARNVEKLLNDARNKVEVTATSLRQLPEKLVEAGIQLGLTRGEVESSPRFRSAQNAVKILELTDKSSTNFVKDVGGLNWSSDDETGAKVTVDRATTMLSILNSTSWQVFGLLRQGGTPTMTDVLTSAQGVLKAAEWSESLENFKKLEASAWKLVKVPVPDPHVVTGGINSDDDSKAVKIDFLLDGNTSSIADRLTQALTNNPAAQKLIEEGEVTVHIELRRKQ